MKISAPFSTIAPKYATLDWCRREVAIRIGHKADHKLLGRSELSYIDSIIESGVHQFMSAAFPKAPVEPQAPAGEGRDPDALHVESEKEMSRKAPHRWSFAERIHEFTTASGTSTYQMPADFGAIIDEPTTTQAGGRIAVARESHIRQMISVDNESAEPRYCALRRSSIGGASEQKTDLILYPVPDSALTIQVSYRANPPDLTDSKQYLPGGVEHAETLLAFCFYVLAQRRGEGLNEAIVHVQDRLVASIVIDRSASKLTTDGIWIEDDGRCNVAWLSRMIGRHIGAGPNPKVWTHQQEQMIAEIIRRARRRVYNPPVLPGELKSHDWYWARPTGRLTTESGVWAYDMPADYVQLYGPVHYEGGGDVTDSDGNTVATGTVLYKALQVRGEAQLMQLLQRQDASTRPTICAVRPKKFNKAQGTRYEMLVWPVPDARYTLNFRYRINPDTSTANSLPAMVEELDLHGGDRYSELYLEAAMLDADYMMGKKRSEHEERFMRAVQTAVAQDRASHASQNLGPNRDPRSNRGDWHGSYHDLDENLVSYEGTVYED